MDTLPAGYVSCSVEQHYCAWLVTFDTGETLLLQSDWDQAAFAAGAVGGLECPADWNGTPSTLPGWEGFDCSDIVGCSDEYLSVADNA